MQRPLSNIAGNAQDNSRHELSILAAIFGWKTTPAQIQLSNSRHALMILQSHGINSRDSLKRHYKKVFDQLAENESLELLKSWMDGYSGGVSLFQQVPRWWPSGYDYWTADEISHTDRRNILLHLACGDTFGGQSFEILWDNLRRPRIQAQRKELIQEVIILRQMEVLGGTRN